MLRSIWTQVWITLVVATVLLAFYTSLGRQLIPLIETQKPELEAFLQEQLGLPVAISQLKGGWNLLSPVVRLENIGVGPDDAQIQVRRIEAELDISASAFYFMPVFKRIEVDGVKVPLTQADDGRFYLGSELLGGTALNRAQNPEKSPESKETPPALKWLGYQQAISLTDWKVTNAHSAGDETLLVRHLLWRNRGDQHALEGDVAWGREEIADIFLSASLRGPLWPWDEQDGEIYLRVDEQQWNRWIPASLPRELALPSLRGSLEGWLSVSDGDLSSLYATAKIPQLTLQAPENNLELTKGRVLIAGERKNEDWHLSIQPQFDEALPVNEVRISSVQLDEKRGWQFGIPGVDVQALSAFILDYNLLPEKFARYVENLNARGQASNLRISMVKDMPGIVDVRADIAGLTTESFIGIPSFTDADGSIHLQAQGGVAHIRDQALSMHIEGVYNPTWDLTNASAQFYWDIKPEFFNLRLTNLDATLKDARVYGDMAIRIPRRDTDVEYHMGLMLGLENASVTLQEELVPDILDPAINEWLDTGLVEGQVSNVAFILNGHTGSDIPENSLTTQLYLEADKARINYLEEWPEVTDVTGRVFLNAPDLDVWVDSADTLGGNVASGARVKLRDTRKGTELTVSGTIKGEVSEALSYLQTTPLAEIIDHSLDDWSGEGSASSDMRLSMILSDPDAIPDVELQSQILDTKIRLESADLEFSDLNGPLIFTTKDGLSSPGLSGRTFGGDVSLTLNSVATDNSYRITGDAVGKAKWADFKDWADFFLLDPVSGDVNYEANIEVDPALDQPVHLLVETELEGTVVDLPFPAGKRAEDKRSLTALVAPGDETDIAVNYDGLFSTAVRLNDEGAERGQIVFGGAPAKLGEGPGIAITGHIPAELNVSDWWDVWDRVMLLIDEDDARLAAAGQLQPLEPNALGNTNPISSIDMTIAALNAYDVPVEETRVSGVQEFDEWTIQVQNNLAQGTVVIRDDDAEPLVLLMDFVHIPEPQEPAPDGSVAEGTVADTVEDAQAADVTATAVSEEDEGPAPDTSELYDPLEEVIPGDIVAIDFTVQEVYFGTRNLGRWQGTTRPIPSGTAIEILDSDMKGLRMQGRMDWVMREGQHATRMTDFDITASNVGNVQKGFRLQPVVEGKDLKSKLSLSWIGSPAGFNTQTLDGTANVRISNGKVNAEGAGALKAFGVLNFNSVARRLRLDFSDLVGSGMAFDTLKASAKIEQGLFTFVDPLTVDGPGGKFLTSGNTDLNSGDLDMKMAVTFPVTSTLPIVAVLAGFAPPVAASIYVTERLIGDELERFTSASYTIQGTWEEPDIKLNKAFDNSVEGKESRGFVDRFLSIFGLGSD